MTGYRPITDWPGYRYTLHRDVAPLYGRGRLCFVMLNPSTADDTVDDPTIRRVMRFTRDAGYAELEVVNLFAARATNPRRLFEHDDPVGRDNRDHLRAAFARADDVVCAWGASGGRRARPVASIVRVWIGQADHRPLCLGVTATGEPCHPLYVPAAQPLVPFTMAVAS